MHVSLFLLTPASFALLASSCCRVWCQLLALVGLNSSIEAGRARPLVRLAALERISDHLRGVVMSIRATRRVLNVPRSACGAIRQEATEAALPIHR